MSWFQRLKEGFSKTSTKITQGITDIVTKTTLDDHMLEELEDHLIMTDMGVNIAAKLCDGLRKKRFDKDITPEAVNSLLAEHVAEILTPFATPIQWAYTADEPDVLIVVGINGAGKTTTIGKLLPYLKGLNRKMRVVAGDTFRAAAVNQLKEWGARAGMSVAAGKDGGDAAALAYQEITAAKENGEDLVLVDTAGRLHTKTNLMEELRKIVTVTKKCVDASRIHCVMVLDATSGQNILRQVEKFNEYIPLTGLIMTKLDGTSKGGVLVNVVQTTKLPVHFIGVGETSDDLQEMNADVFAQNLFGLRAEDKA